MDHFDFTGMRVDNAFRCVFFLWIGNRVLFWIVLMGPFGRRLCAKLYLRGESQIIDRILVDFSRRYWEHNPTSVLGNASM